MQVCSGLFLVCFGRKALLCVFVEMRARTLQTHILTHTHSLCLNHRMRALQRAIGRCVTFKSFLIDGVNKSSQSDEEVYSS